MFIAHNHNNYAQYVPVYLITLINLPDTLRRCKELLKQNGFSVSQSLVLCLRNAFDITIRQTINPVPSQRRYYKLPFSSNFEDNELYVLSFGVPAKPGIAKYLIEADGIGKKAFADFIDSLLVENLSFTTP